MLQVRLLLMRKLIKTTLKY